MCEAESEHTDTYIGNIFQRLGTSYQRSSCRADVINQQDMLVSQLSVFADIEHVVDILLPFLPVQ